MSIVVLVGGQWGDEGKGKITDILAEKADIVVRFSGGDNAGHTVINPQGEFKLHLIPSGIFHPKTTCILGNGVAINPEILLAEIDSLQSHGIDVSNLFISDRAHIIMPYHTLLDRLEEERKGSKAIGTTLKGIGPVFSDKVARLGIRACDLVNRDIFKERLASVLQLKNEIITKVYRAEPLSFDAIYEKYCVYAEKLAKYVRKTGEILHDAVQKNKRILMEGAQGAMLDPDFGTYPYVTSSSPLAANASIGSGIAMNAISKVLGVYKAYTTRVGGGPMPTELKDEIGEMIRQRAQEYGATTGRPRRCGWFDAVVAKYSCRINGCDAIALTRLDILDNLPVIKICVGYAIDGKMIEYFPTCDDELSRCQPVYEEMEGWQEPISEIRDMKKLPKGALRYIRKLEQLLKCPIYMVSVGAVREQTITVKEIFI